MKKYLVSFVAVIMIFSLLAYSIAEETFYPGVYYVGKDIKVGSYTIRSDNSGGWVDIYRTEAEYLNDDIPKMMLFSEDGIHLSLTDGMVIIVHLYAVYGKLTIVTEKPSWAP